ncbi:beta-ketoacyl-ACP synthase III [Helicobacter cappadocius]|uniref:Beta-ketoacyl-[acyl-carrier-protein] synthase III n=1 Tax=Helicobacter cappadocius TaxID=3063998 RepID=A0AA90PQW5_9HELI|nr:MULTISPECIES: beta-ketoacyl-ACP synthase III [unclassified Helicobacter]MDO7252600.1 beta-ketoacyl-ACP synthase III [Helicobacter sp. faydin-H75]MDP2538467.1 beta-ketoacyl-ACP synthase III [Helicobacter sp. faydin-H76]
MKYACLKSIASYVPKRCVKNSEFEKTLDTTDEWIQKRTGIQTRYFASDEENTSDLGFQAAKLALDRSGLQASDIDLVIVATLSPDYLNMPSTACLISAKLGIRNKPAFDISTACSGFIYLLSLAKAFIESNTYNNILIIGAEKVSSVLDFTDRGTCVLFGDGAGAAVITPTTDKNHSILDVHISADGAYNDFLFTPRVTKKSEFIQGQSIPQCIQMKGNETFKLGVKTLISDVEEILQKNEILPSQVDFFIPHQANLRIISAVGEQLKFSSEQVVITVQKYGNTSAASIPMAMNDVYESGRLKSGNLILLDAFGGGVTWGSALLYFGG